MDKVFEEYILNLTQASEILRSEKIQSLWSGYGNIIRIYLKGGIHSSVVVKLMVGNTVLPHPRGWNNKIGHQRKIHSYKVENTWYKYFSQKGNARTPKYHGYIEHAGQSLLVLEDLNESGFHIRKQHVNNKQFYNCVEWLAQFHADFMQTTPNGLWKTGTYWHLDTRPEEMEALKDESLKKAAHKIDLKLKSSSYQTLVHGDAKLANFCFSQNDKVAGLDFQYVGGGCGMKDLAYFTGSCLSEELCEENEQNILDFYFLKLQQHSASDTTLIEKEWRPLYRVAWADFHRFLKGWSPNHWKINGYSERITVSVVKNLT